MLRGERELSHGKRFWQWTRYEVVPMHNAAVRDGPWKLVSAAQGPCILGGSPRAMTHDMLGWQTMQYANADMPEQAGVDLPAAFPTHEAYRDFLFEQNRAPKPCDVETYPPAPPVLFDLGSDPGETHDLSAQCPAVAARLTHALHNWFDGIVPQAERYRAADPYAEYPGCRPLRTEID
jgi:hypothetical protein